MCESNLRCKCGEPLFFTDTATRHRMYHCLSCDELYVVKGDNHYMLLDEIDVKTGQIIPMEQTAKGKIYVAKESKRLKKLYGIRTVADKPIEEVK
jgi:hypothetical protein